MDFEWLLVLALFFAIFFCYLLFDNIYKYKLIKRQKHELLYIKSNLAQAKSEIGELKSKPKSAEALEILQELNSSGSAILNIERIPNENVYFRAGTTR